MKPNGRWNVGARKQNAPGRRESRLRENPSSPTQYTPVASAANDRTCRR